MGHKKIISFLFILLIIGVSVGLAILFTKMKPKPEYAPPDQLRRMVETQLVRYDKINTSIEAPGRLVPGKTVEIISEAQGKILQGKVPLKKGQHFDKGDLLCKIYDEEQVLSLKASKSRFLNSLANALPDIKFDYPDDYDMVLDFFQKIDISKPLPNLPKLNDRSLKVFLASRDILNQYYTIQVAEERLRKHFIYAPFDGSIMEVYLQVGGFANIGTRIAKVIETEIMELEVPVFLQDLPWISIGDKVKVYDETRTQSWNGKVARISDFIDPTTQSASVFVQVRNTKENPVYPGMYLIAVFNGKTVDEAMEIPRQAVFNQDEVFIVVDSTLQKSKINILKINRHSLVFNGLEEGTEIVVEPLINVKEGTMILTKRTGK